MTVADRIWTFVDEGLGHSSYLVDLGDGHALAIDPPRLPARALETAKHRGLTITWTADTHSHADYVSGSPELAARGATFIASRGANL
jgi:hydroxyacylglutathione hydrolase